MKLLKTILLTLLLLIIITSGLAVFAPAVLVAPIAGLYLSSLGIRVYELEQLQIGSASLTADSVRFESQQVSILVSGIEAQFSPSELLQGRFRSLNIQRLNIEVLATDAGNTPRENTQSLTDLLQALESIPIARITIVEARVELDNQQFEIQLEFQSEPLRITGNAALGQEPGWTFDLSAVRSATNTVTGHIDSRLNRELVVETDFEVTVAEQNIDLTANSTVQLGVLKEIPVIAAALAPYDVLTETLTVESISSIEDPFVDPAIASIKLIVDNPGSLFHIAQQSPSSSTDMQIHLPLLIDGESDSLNSALELSISDIYTTFSQNTDGGEANVEATLSEVTVSCATFSSCLASVELKALSNTFQFGDIRGENLSLTGALNVSYSDNILELSSPSLELSLPSIITETLSGSFDLSLQSLALIVANQTRGRFSFVSNSVELGINNFSLNNPSLFGEFRFRENTVAGSLELALNNQLKISAIAEHDLSNNSGFAEIDMPRYGFSRLTPLSSLLEQSFLDGDIVAGNIAGRAELSWNRNADRSWNYSGPLDLNVQNLSGFYEDSFFVDLDTELSANLSSPLGVRSRNELSATLANLDAGIPVSNVKWRYEFDSADRQFSVYDLTTEVLGGNISVPVFDYSGEREENKLNVILTGLDLNYIVNLADYPNLLVDGLISGYLPLILRQDRLTIDGGLVAALQPGGSIRYTPANPIPSSNPTVQLVNDALSNYQFETLNTEVYYDENGDLRMQIQLRGTNPDMNAGQPINLNINITDNIPTLLRSLQASRVITDELEQRLAR